MKYISQEEPTTPTDNGYLEELQGQLKEKELERASMLELVKKLECEKNELVIHIDTLDKEKTNILMDNTKLRNEIEELHRASMNPHYIQREKELEAKLNLCYKQLKEQAMKIEEFNQNKSQEALKQNDELFILREKLKKIPTLENINMQQEKQIQELLEKEETLKCELSRISEVEDQMKIMKGINNEIENKYATLVSEYSEDKSSVIKMSNAMNEAVQNYEKICEEKNKIEERAIHLEKKVIQFENIIRNQQEEISSYKLKAEAGGLLSQERENMYQQKIDKLEKQLEDLIDGKTESNKSKIIELENKLDIITSEKERITQELIMTKQQRDELEQENDSILEQIETCKEISKDQILNIKSKAKSIKSNSEECTKLKSDLIILQDDIEKFKTTVKSFKEEIDLLNEKNLNLERELAKSKEQRHNLEDELKDQSNIELKLKGREVEIEKRITDQFKLEIKNLEEKYKAKIIELKAQISKKDENLNNALNNAKQMENDHNNILKKLKDNYENKISKLNIKITDEKENARKGIRNITENKRIDEEMIETIMDEISLITNNLAKEKEKGISIEDTQKIITKLTDIKNIKRKCINLFKAN